MTTGEFKSFPIDAIFIDRENRQRRELKNIQELAWSINAAGLINPITIKRNGELVAGERRLMAIKTLGWTSVPVQFIEDLPPDQVKLIELEENIRREELPWQEHSIAVYEYHQLRSSEDDWSWDKTAKALNISTSSLGRHMSVAKALIEGEPQIVSAPKQSTAVGIIARREERARAAVLNKLNEVDKREIPLINDTFENWLAQYKGERIFNFIHCDFPYGIKADSHASGAAPSFGGYTDTFDVYEQLLEVLAQSMDKVVADSAHLMFWFSMDYYEYTRIKLEKMGWRINPFPLIWHKSDNTGIMPDPKRGPRRIYETAFFGSRGDRPVVKPISNVIAAPVIKTVHMSEKPIGVLTGFMRMIVDEYTVGLDPTCGSGNAVKTMLNGGANAALGIEKDKGFYEAAKAAFFDKNGGFLDTKD